MMPLPLKVTLAAAVSEMFRKVTFGAPIVLKVALPPSETVANSKFWPPSLESTVSVTPESIVRPASDTPGRSDDRLISELAVTWILLVRLPEFTACTWNSPGSALGLSGTQLPPVAPAAVGDLTSILRSQPPPPVSFMTMPSKYVCPLVSAGVNVSPEGPQQPR